MDCPEEILQIWGLVQETLRGEFSQTAYDLWYSDLKPWRYDPATKELIFHPQNKFKCDILNGKKALIEKHFADIGGIDVHARFTSPSDGTDVAEPIKEQNLPHTAENKAEYGTAQEEETVVQAQRGNYTFSNFIVGETNKFARAACWKVSNNPSSEWNPLFLYGPSGVGKTHLMYAIINEIRRHNPDIRVTYTKGDEFVNYMVECLANKTMETFRNRYRRCDVLLVDDIQFIAGKVATQEEFFNTFQTLFDEGKQIILASDRPPRDIHPLEERLRSRFEQGLLADINPPNLELRVAIIKKKAEDMQIMLSDDVLSYLAENLRSNIRQIEGAIKKLAAKSIVDGRHISMELARSCVADMLGDMEPLDVTIEKIFSAVIKKYGVPKEEIIGKKRTKEIVKARHIAIYLIRQITDLSFPAIGKILNQNHTTVMSSIDVVKKNMASDPMYAGDIEDLRHEIETK